MGDGWRLERGGAAARNAARRVRSSEQAFGRLGEMPLLEMQGPAIESRRPESWIALEGAIVVAKRSRRIAVRREC